MSKRKKWSKGEFSKTTVRFCLTVMTATLIWAALLATVALVLDRTVYINDILVFAGAFFGGELCLLAFKRIFAKERSADNGNMDTDSEPDHCAGSSSGDDFSDPLFKKADDADGMGDDAKNY